jgi:hypothetical protein
MMMIDDNVDHDDGNGDDGVAVILTNSAWSARLA